MSVTRTERSNERRAIVIFCPAKCGSTALLKALEKVFLVKSYVDDDLTESDAISVLAEKWTKGCFDKHCPLLLHTHTDKNPMWSVFGTVRGDISVLSMYREPLSYFFSMWIQRAAHCDDLNVRRFVEQTEEEDIDVGSLVRYIERDYGLVDTGVNFFPHVFAPTLKIPSLYRDYVLKGDTRVYNASIGESRCTALIGKQYSWLQDEVSRKTLCDTCGISTCAFSRFYCKLHETSNKRVSSVYAKIKQTVRFASDVVEIFASNEFCQNFGVDCDSKYIFDGSPNTVVLRVERKSASNAQRIVETCYREILQREVDHEGLCHYKKKLMQGSLNEQGLRKILTESQEFRVLRENNKTKEVV